MKINCFYNKKMWCAQKHRRLDENEKKRIRLERFLINDDTNNSSDDVKLSKRIERFGIVESQPSPSDVGKKSRRFKSAA